MTIRAATFRNRRYNSYVPAAQYAADVIHSAPHQVDYGTPIVAAAASILSLQSIAVAGATITFLNDTIADNFGRNLTVIASGAATSNVTVFGRDYLGQPVAESFTLNGAVSVVGNKAFKWLDRVTFGATAATTINLGVGAKFGLPYRASNIYSETVDGAAVATGTLQAPSYVDPQTAITADPRGMYTPTTVPDGIKRIQATIKTYTILNAAERGGLYGLAHFSG